MSYLIFDEQENEIFQNTSLKIKLIKGDEIKYLYIPHFIWQKYSKDYNLNEIELDDTLSIWSFLECVKNIIDNHNKIKIIDCDSIFQKIKIFHLYFNFKYVIPIEDIQDLFGILDIANKLEIHNMIKNAIMLAIHHSWETHTASFNEFKSQDMYRLIKKYPNYLPDTFLKTINLTLRNFCNYSDGLYDIFILNKLNCIIMRPDGINRYQYTFENNGFEWIIYQLNIQSNKIIKFSSNFASIIDINNHTPKYYGIYDTINSMQDNESFKNLCTNVYIIDNDEKYNIFIPDMILKELDNEYYEVMKSNKFMKSDFEIILTEYESYKAYLDFLCNYLENKNKLMVKSLTDVQKYVIASRFNKTGIYVNIEYKNELDELNYDLVINNLPDYLIDDFLLKCLSHNYIDLYSLNIIYPYLPTTLFVNKTYEIIKMHLYDLHILYKFKNIKYAYDDIQINRKDDGSWEILYDYKLRKKKKVGFGTKLYIDNNNNVNLYL